MERTLNSLGVIGRIAFAIHTADMIHHFEPIWRWLDPSSFDCVRVGQSALTASMLDERGLRWTTFEGLCERGEIYEVVVAAHMLPEGSALVRPPGGYRVERVGKLRIRMMYALGKSGWNFGDWNKIFDVLLVHGPSQAAALSFCQDAAILQVGYPRYDDILVGRPGHSTWSPPAARNRPLVAWLPTWGRVSSLGPWTSAVSRLTKEFDVLVKPHPYCRKMQSVDVAQLEGGSWSGLLWEDVSSAEVMAAADLVLCDYGGSPFGAAILDKHVLLLNSPYALREGEYGPSSFDVALRSELASLDLDASEQLESVLNAESTWEGQAGARQRVRSMHVAPTYGFAGKVAAMAIRNAGRMVRGRGSTDRELGNAIGASAAAVVGPVFDMPWVRERVEKASVVVGWGAGGFGREVLGRTRLRVDYLVDSDREKQGSVVEGVDVLSPDALRRQDREGLFVLVLSSSHVAIYERLEEWGLRPMVDFI